LSRLIGVADTLELLLSARELNGEDAREIGLVSRVYADDELFDRVFDYCASIANGASPWSLRTIKQQVYQDLMSPSLVPAFERAETLMQEALAGPDFAEGVAALRDRRPPSFAPLAPGLARLSPWAED
jgi:enoyl-CoA hydratase/carnithine racemase